MPRKKESITSLELLEQINYFRKQEGTRVELQHKDLLKIIREEFSDEKDEGNISPMSVEKDAGNTSLMSEGERLQNILEVNGGNIPLVNEKKKLPVKESYYTDKKGEKRPMYILTLSQGKQVLVRESKYVRRATIQYLEKLEERLFQITMNMNDERWLELREHEKATRKLEMETIKELVAYAKEQGSKHPEKLYTVYSRLIHTLLGDKSKDREALPLFDTLDVLRLEQVIDRVIKQGMEEKKHYKEIYKDCHEAGLDYIKVLRIA